MVTPACRQAGFAFHLLYNLDMRIVFNEIFLKHNEGSDFEGPYRIKGFLNDPEVFVKKINGEKYLELVHSKRYVQEIKKASQESGVIAEVQLTPESFKAAIFAVGLTVYASENNDFAVVRPPGHHAAEGRASGFCLFNNVAVATKKLLKKGKKVAILDIDGHHGDGTQAIFKGVPNIYYCSIHQTNTFPGTGLVSEKNCFNISLTQPIEEEQYLKALDICIEKIKEFSPDTLGVSVGFDTFKEDRLLNFNLEVDTYKEIGKKLGRNFKEIFAALEGGYHDKISDCTKSFVAGVNTFTL